MNGRKKASDPSDPHTIIRTLIQANEELKREVAELKGGSGGMDKTALDDLQRELKELRVENGNMYTLRKKMCGFESMRKGCKGSCRKMAQAIYLYGMRSDADVERSATAAIGVSYRVWDECQALRTKLSAANAEIGNLKRQLAAVTGGTSQASSSARRVARKSNDNYPGSLEVVEEDALMMMMMMMTTTRLQSLFVGTHLG